MSASVGGGVVSGRVVSLNDNEDAGEIDGRNPSWGMGDGDGPGLFDGGRKCDGLGVR